MVVIITCIVISYGELPQFTGSQLRDNNVELCSQDALLTGVSLSLCLHSNPGRSSNDE